jgi:hypothetical protein
MDIQIRDVFFFDTMIAPKIITGVYWLLLAVTVVGGIFTMFTSFLAGLLGMIVAVVFVRIWCELMILLFKVNENIKRLADATAGVASTPSKEDLAESAVVSE